MALDDLPQEIILLIVTLAAQLGPITNLPTLSSRWKRIVEPMLYAKVYLSIETTEPIKPAWSGPSFDAAVTYFQFVDTLHTRAILCRHVTELLVSVARSEQLLPRQYQLSTLVDTLSNLTTLSLYRKQVLAQIGDDNGYKGLLNLLQNETTHSTGILPGFAYTVKTKWTLQAIQFGPSNLTDLRLYGFYGSYTPDGLFDLDMCLRPI